MPRPRDVMRQCVGAGQHPGAATVAAQLLRGGGEAWELTKVVLPSGIDAPCDRQAPGAGLNWSAVERARRRGGLAHIEVDPVETCPPRHRDHLGESEPAGTDCAGAEVLE